MPDPRTTGAIRYPQDVEMEGMLHARFVRSSVAHARIVSVDASQVRDGVVVLAAVAAESEAEAEEAANLIDIEYEELPAVFDALEAVSEEAPIIHDLGDLPETVAYFGIRPQRGTNVCHLFRLRHGDVGAGFEEADVVV